MRFLKVASPLALLVSLVAATTFYAEPRVPPVARGHGGALGADQLAARGRKYAKPIIGGIEIDEGYIARREQGEKSARPDAQAGVHQKVRNARRQGGNSGSGEQDEGYMIYNETNYPTPDKTFTLAFTRELWAPDGFPRIHYLLNGRYQADIIEVDEDDWVEITVINNTPTPFSVHWHGIKQIGTPQNDGVPGVTQYNIPSNSSYVYYWQAKGQYGAFWAHSHELGYYSDGLRLPMYVRPKPGRAKPWSLISNDSETIQQLEWAEGNYTVNFRSDQWHITADEMELEVHETGVPPACMNSLLMNGHGRAYCFNNWTAVAQPVASVLLASNRDVQTDWSSRGCLSLVPPKPGFDAVEVLDSYFGGKCENTTAPIAVFNAGKALAAGRRFLNMQVIDAETNWYSGFSVDNHKMWLVAVDSVYIEPKVIEFAQLTIGSRISVMIELDESKGDAAVRYTGLRALQPIEGFALLTYNASVGDTIDLSIDEGFHHLTTRVNSSVTFGGAISATAVQWNQSADVPFQPEVTVPQEANVTLHAYISQGSLNVWQMATQPADTVKMSEMDPILFQLTTEGKRLEDIDTSMVPTSPLIPDGSVVDIIFQNPLYSIVGKSNAPHPAHLHHHLFHVIGSGTGEFNYDTVAEAQAAGVRFNLDNPPRRDGYDIAPNGWTVFRFVADAHGAAVLVHCHIDDHLVQGMATVILEGIDLVPPGTFSSRYTERPSNLRNTEHDPVQVELKDSWSTGSSIGAWASTVNPTNPWGDPRSDGRSLQSIASQVSVSRAAQLAQQTASSNSSGVPGAPTPAPSAGASVLATNQQAVASAPALGGASAGHGSHRSALAFALVLGGAAGLGPLLLIA